MTMCYSDFSTSKGYWLTLYDAEGLKPVNLVACLLHVMEPNTVLATVVVQ